MTDNQSVRRLPVIRVFVSSTFTDLQRERDALQRDTFPRLEPLCATRGFQFQAIDLRWGVPTEASLDHRTMRICFEELRRAQEISPQPNFLVLLGDRYGWRPLPEDISVEEFEALNRTASLIGAGDILRAWYVEDRNAVPRPVYVLQSRKKRFADGKDYTSDAVWNETQDVLWRVINRAFPPEQLSRRFEQPASLDAPLPAIVRFQASATEQEIWRGALGVPNAREHVLAFFREITNLPDLSGEPALRTFVDVDTSGQLDKPARDALRDLKQQLRERLGPSNVFEYKNVRLSQSVNEKGEPRLEVTTDHLTDLCNRVYAALEPIITRQIDDYWAESSAARSSPNPAQRSQRALELERLEHQRFGEERGPERTFVGRVRELEAIQVYLSNASRQPLAVHGASGCGKTALLARAAQLADARWKPIVRYIGIHSRSSDLRSLLSSLCQEIRLRHPGDKELPGDVPELIREWREHLDAATAADPLVFFLDALDQLAAADNGRALNWIPFGALPEHVKLVVSCLSDRPEVDPAGEPFTALQRRMFAPENYINLDTLSVEEAQLLFFERWLPEGGRKLNEQRESTSRMSQQEAVQARLQSHDCRQPLYLKILFEEARLWRSYDPVSEIGGNVPELLDNLFRRLGDPANHGPTVECALGYIATARRGLTELEILEALYRDENYCEYLNETAKKTQHRLPDNPKRVPVALWSRLRFDLSPYLAEPAAPGGTVLNFYHRQVGEYVREQFLDMPAKRLARLQRLAKYFAEQDYFLESLEEQRARARRLPPTPRPANVRKVDELPWQLLEVAKLAGKDDPKSPHWDAVADLFTDLHFLEAKAEAQA